MTKENGEESKDSLTCTVGIVPRITLDQIETMVVLLSEYNTYTIITGVRKLLVNNIWVVDSDARVELFRYRLKMDENTKKTYFSKVQYRFSRGHNAAKNATFLALDNSDLDKLVTFLTNTVQPNTTEITEMFWCQIEN